MGDSAAFAMLVSHPLDTKNAAPTRAACRGKLIEAHQGKGNRLRRTVVQVGSDSHQKLFIERGCAHASFAQSFAHAIVLVERGMQLLYLVMQIMLLVANGFVGAAYQAEQQQIDRQSGGRDQQPTAMLGGADVAPEALH